MAVYNVEGFLEESVSSLVNQTIGFENVQVILVDDGKILAVGSHSELLEKSELYKEMVYLQSLEKEVNGGEA